MNPKLALLAAAASLAFPATATAAKPTTTDRQNAAQECRAERGTTPATREAFAAKYGTNASRSNAFGKCVSRKAREEAAEAAAAKRAASRTCREERAADRPAFRQKYGSNGLGPCIRQQKAAKEAKADAKDAAARADRRNAAETCAEERGTTAESRKAFNDKYGTNGSKRNAFGKCVSKTAQAS